MRYAPHARDLISTAAAAAVIGAAPAVADRTPEVRRPEPTPACSVELVPGSVTAGRPDTRVLAETDRRSAEGRPRVEVSPGSGIRVRDVRSDVSPGSWILLLDLSDARAGTWTVTLEGDGYRCSGRLRIRGAVGTAGIDSSTRRIRPAR
ncbi:MAG: hypothetical protein ABEJ00_03485 [Gemmatimonadota bacterium]